MTHDCSYIGNTGSHMEEVVLTGFYRECYYAVLVFNASLKRCKKVIHNSQNNCYCTNEKCHFDEPQFTFSIPVFSVIISCRNLSAALKQQIQSPSLRCHSQIFNDWLEQSCITKTENEVIHIFVCALLFCNNSIKSRQWKRKRGAWKQKHRCSCPNFPPVWKS